MHRSGTSLVGRIAHLAGVDMGDKAGFHPPDKWNPDGYFEQESILDINIRLVNGPWGRAAYFRLPSDGAIRRRAERLRPEIDGLVATYQGKTVKENRFCLTLGAWRDRGLDVERLLVVFRYPADVARSLWRRNRIPARLALALWKEHHERLLANSRGIPKQFLDYDKLVGGCSDSLREQRKIAWLLDCSEQQIQEVCDDVVHTQDRKRTARLPAGIQADYEQLEAMSETAS